MWKPEKYPLSIKVLEYIRFYLFIFHFSPFFFFFFSFPLLMVTSSRVVPCIPIHRIPSRKHFFGAEFHRMWKIEQVECFYFFIFYLFPGQRHIVPTREKPHAIPFVF